MHIVSRIKPLIAATLSRVFAATVTAEELTINTTKPEFEGDYTLVLFGFVKQFRQSPEQLGETIGQALCQEHDSLF